MAVSRTQRLWIALAILFGIVVLGFGAAYLQLRGDDEPSPPTAREVAQDYLAAWQDRRWPRLQSLIQGEPPAAPLIYQAQLDGLGADRVQTRLLSGRGTARSWTGRFEAALRVPATGLIKYAGDLNLAQRQGKWRVVWTPAAVHPKLPAGGSFAASVPRRGSKR